MGMAVWKLREGRYDAALVECLRNRVVKSRRFGEEYGRSHHRCPRNAFVECQLPLTFILYTFTFHLLTIFRTCL